MPKITVIVPVYNVEKYLNRCIESIVNQTHNDLEIILVDDASPDNCPKMCDEWAERDSRIKVLHIENEGVANARNKALAVATGDYVAFVDSDDYIEPDMLEVLLKVLQQGDCDIAVCDYQINDEELGTDNEAVLTAKEVLTQIAQGSYKYGVLWNKLYKKSVLSGVEMPRLRYSEDLVFNYRAFKNATTVAQTDLKLYHYFQNEESAVHNSFDKSNYDAVTARKIILDDADAALKEFAVLGYVRSLFIFLSQIISTGNCYDMLDEVRAEILKYKGTVAKSSLFSKKDRLKVSLLSMGINVYKKAFSKFK